MGVSRLHKLVLLPDSRAAPPARQGFQVLVEVPVTPSPAPPLFPKTVVRFFLDVLKSATKIFGSEMAPSLLLELFQKVIQNGKGKRP